MFAARVRLSPSPTRVISSHHRRLREYIASNPKRWLVTGVAGFIGSHLLDELLRLGQTVIGVDNFSTGHRSNVAQVLAAHPASAQRFTLHEGDIRDANVCRAACNRVDYVLHHAALGSVPRSIDDPMTTHAVNVDGFITMLSAAKDAGVARFVYASSSAVYGDSQRQPQVEDSIGRPLSPYAASKSINETYAMAFQQTYRMQSIGLRYFNIFGPRQDPNGAYAAVIPRWASKLLSGETCEIFGDGESTRDFCYVANVVQANLLAATEESSAASGEVYNVACSRSLTLNELFGLMRDGVRSVLPEASAPPARYRDFREGDIRYSGGSIEKARRLLSYCPTHSVAEGMTETLSWYVAGLRSATSAMTPYASAYDSNAASAGRSRQAMSAAVSQSLK